VKGAILSETNMDPTPSGARAGDRDVRAYVGPPDQYDVVGANQFVLLVMLGLREHHDVLDIGCGSLRLGKLLLPYLEPGRYCGVEPEQWLVEEGIETELSQDFVDRRKPEFRYADDFSLQAFGRQFDYLVAQSIFSHATAEQVAQCMKAAAEVLRPDGSFVATFVIGDSDYRGTKWVYPECVTYTPERIERFAHEAGLHALQLGYPHPGQQTWYAFTRGETSTPTLGQDVATLSWQLELANRRVERMMANPLIRTGMRTGRALQRARRRFSR
jgi:SAM-dependent methyltransferase